MYAVFADWAKKHGVEAALGRFSNSIPEAPLFAEQWKADLARVESGGPPIISAGREGWYSGPGLTGRFWPPLRDHFRAEWPAARVAEVDQASSMVVAHTPRPTSQRSARGLVVGYVQSGKTTNFTSVIAKLADEDYDLIIVLSGIHNGLRRQTQERLHEQLVELNSDHWLSLTDLDRDFHTPTANAAAFLTAQGKVALAVVKKNPVVLRRLIGWLKKEGAQNALARARVLVIDDEADQASVATARINPQIRELLRLMPRSVYIGYTATPFANVFIDPTADDLYPQDFILNLPQPPGYFGPEVVFGRDDDDGDDVDGLDMVRRIPDAHVGLLRPLNQAAAATFQPTITDDVVAAVRWFWLATAARRARDDLGHSTMLIHTSVKTTVHEAFLGPLEQLCADTLAALRDGDPRLLDELSTQWTHENDRVGGQRWGRPSESFADVAPHLEDVVGATQVLMDNFRSNQRLDYSGDPVVAIAVGGNTLSRGLTLEGLVVSLFVRGATAYDTLLQMGRWFGYRTGYEDLPRIWTTQELELAFRHLAQVEHEMRADIDFYQSQDTTPADVAVRVRTHPSLRITAKMGAAAPADVSYAGRRVQTRYFRHRDAQWLARNREAAGRLVTAASRVGDGERIGSGVLYRGVPVQGVLAFLREYQVHEDSPDIDPELIVRYIDEQVAGAPPRLTEWNVAVVDGDGTPMTIGPLSVRTSIRAKLKGDREDRADIKTLMSKTDLVLDLQSTGKNFRGMAENALKQFRQDAESQRGLIVLYAIDAFSAPQTQKALALREPLDAVDVVVGLGMYFPGAAGKATRILATHVSVPKSLLDYVEVEDLDDALDVDHEDDA